MATERLSVILELISGQYKKEARESAASTRQIGDAAAQTATQSTSSFGRIRTGMMSTASVAKAALGGVAVGAVVQVLGNLDQLNQKMEATERMADTVFGEMADDARAWADQNNEAFGIGESAMLSLIAKTQDLLVPMGFARDVAFDMSQEILNTANALSEWEGGTIDAEDAQLRLAKAMLGETEGLVELGVKISQADIQARLAKKGLDGLTGSALQQAKAQVTLEIVMERSTDALAAYEDRAGTATAAQKDLAASTADTEETWAELLSGPMAAAKGAIADVADIAQFLSDKAAENAGATQTQGEAQDGLTRIWEAATPVGAFLLDVLDNIAEATQNNVEPSLEAAEAARFMADAHKDDLIPIIGESIDLIDRQGQSMGNAAKAADTQRRALINLANAQADLLDPIGNVLRLQIELERAQKELTDAQSDGETPARDLALAVLEVEQAELRLQAAGAALTPDQIQAFAQVLIEDFGQSEEQALRTLDALNLLDGWTGSASFTLTMNTVAAGGGGKGNINSDIFEFDTGGVVPGPLGSRQLIVAHGGETILPTHKTTSQTFNKTGGTINVYNPKTNNLDADLQKAALYASVQAMVEN